MGGRSVHGGHGFRRFVGRVPLAVLLVAGTVLVGCSVAGRPVAAPSTSTTTAARPSGTTSRPAPTTLATPSVRPTEPIPTVARDLTSLSPCTLLTPAQLTELAVVTERPPHEVAEPGQRYCTWTRPSGAMLISVVPSIDLGEYEWRWDFLIGGYRADRQVEDGRCDFTLAVSVNSIVAVGFVSNADSVDLPTLCGFVQRAAELVATNIPRL